MSKLKADLQSLRQCISIHQLHFQEYSHSFPYVSYRLQDTVRSVMLMLGDLVVHLTAERSKMALNTVEKMYQGEECQNMSAIYVCLSRMRMEIEDIRYVFQRMLQGRRCQVGYILTQLNDLIRQCPNFELQQYNPQTNDSKWKKQTPYVQNRETEKQKCDRIKRQLSEEMQISLRGSPQAIKQKQSHLFSEDFTKAKIYERQLQSTSNPARNTNRNFNYLEIYDNDQKRKIQRQKSQTYHSPQSKRKSSEPSTEEQSSSRITLRNTQEQSQNIQEAQKLDFGTISNIQPRPQVILEDSLEQIIEGQMSGLDDSLQLMKEFEQLNNTGFFGKEQYRQNESEFSFGYGVID